MDVFELRERVIGEYAGYIRSFFTIRDERIDRLVDTALAEGHLWPDPLLQLSPAFEPGDTKRLERYDALAEATKAGTPHVSPLSPPPGDVRARHPK